METEIKSVNEVYEISAPYLDSIHDDKPRVFRLILTIDNDKKTFSITPPHGLAFEFCGATSAAKWAAFIACFTRAREEANRLITKTK